MKGIELSFTLTDTEKILAKLNWRKETEYTCKECDETPSVQPGEAVAWCCWKCGFGTIHPSKYFKLARQPAPAF